MAREALITQEGLEKLKSEIDHLSTVKRREVADRIRDAREFGDIAENSEYDDAKNEQALLEQRIAQLEERLRRANVVDRKSIDTETVGVGVLVHVKDQKSGKSSKFQIVGATEASPGEQKLSNESPIGRALVGHKRGDDRLRRRPPRPEEEAQDHQDRDGLAPRRLGSPGWPSPKNRPRSTRDSQVLEDRREKLERLRAAGVDPFPHDFDGRTEIAEVRAAHEGLGRRRGDRGGVPRRRPHRGAPWPG